MRSTGIYRQTRKTMTLPREVDGRLLAPRRFVAHAAARNPETVRRYCAPVACDVANRTPLYDAAEALDTLATLRS